MEFAYSNYQSVLTLAKLAGESGNELTSLTTLRGDGTDPFLYKLDALYSKIKTRKITFLLFFLKRILN